jgi:hypothetical protein
MTVNENTETEVAYVKNLLSFASGVLTARERVQMKMADTRRGVFREENIKELPGVNVETEDGEWLRVKRQATTKPKGPQEHVAVFLENDFSNPTKKPNLKPAVAITVSCEEASDLAEAGLLRDENVHDVVESGIIREDVVRVVLMAEDLNDMRLNYSTWLSEVWAPWAEQEKPVRISIELYDSLFRIHAAAHAADGVPPEIIWGFGLGHWEKNGLTVDMPLIEQEIEIEVATGGDLLLTPRSRQLELSLKPYLQLEIFGSAALQQRLSELLNLVRQGDTDVTPTDFTALSPILSTAASELDSQGRYLQGEDLPKGMVRATEALQITDRWAVYVRPRSSAARVQDLEELAKAIDDNGAPPLALKGFVAPEPDEEPPTNMFGLTNTLLGTETTSSNTHITSPLEPGMRTDRRNKLKKIASIPTFFHYPTTTNKRPS